MNWMSLWKDIAETATGRPQQHLPSHPHQVQRVRSSRRRILLKRGARIHSTMRSQANTSLAMLDQDGVVVCWYDRLIERDRSDQVVDRHVSQFYLPEDLAREQPYYDLRAARADGRCERQGWYRRPDGSASWATTVIETIRLRNGRLQGFSFVTRACEKPTSIIAPEQAAVPMESGRLEDPSLALIIPTWDRMARSRSTARQRRLFRLACRPIARTPTAPLR